jgi:hypothetical protein
VRKKIFAAVIGSNETETLCVVEPLNSTVCHAVFPYKKTTGGFPSNCLISKTAHGETSTADTLIQTPVRFLPQRNWQRQELIEFIFKTGLKNVR